jgi:hypothetical protein
MRLAYLALIALLLLAAPAEAQRFPQYARAAVEAPQVLARGGAAVALPTAEAALFYNPAHLARLDLPRVRIEVLGAQAGANPKFFGDLRFVQDDVRPALEEGISPPLSQEDMDLFNEAIDRGRRPTMARVAAALPVLTVSTPWGGVGGGLFATNTTRYQFEDLGGGIPLIDVVNQADFIGALGVATSIPGSPVAVGTTGRFARRAIAYKHKDLLAIDPDNEQLYVIGGSTFALDLGLHAADVVPGLPGRIDAGIAVYDLLGGGFDYELDRAISFTGPGPVDQRELNDVLAAFEGRDGSPSFRVGAAYHLPPLAGLADVAVALDYFSVSTSESAQPALSKFRLGAEAQAAGFVRLRAGLSQGYPTFGVGLESRVARLDYAFFGEEDGRLPGQLPRFTHLLQLRLGLFR